MSESEFSEREATLGRELESPGMGAEDELRAQIECRIDTLTAPDYADPAVRPLNRTDYLWIGVLCGVIPVIMLIWGAVSL